MGTNYYIRENECIYCGRYDEIHLGKSSGGWQFCLNLNGKEYYKNFKEMKTWLKGKIIRSEYNDLVSLKDFLEMIEEKQKIYNKDDTHTIKIDGYRFLDTEFS